MTVHCCTMMVDQVTHRCDKHDPFECPDHLIIEIADSDGREYGLITHDGGSSYIRIDYCPWCGTAFNTSPRGPTAKAPPS